MLQLNFNIYTAVIVKSLHIRVPAEDGHSSSLVFSLVIKVLIHTSLFVIFNFQSKMEYVTIIFNLKMFYGYNGR